METIKIIDDGQDIKDENRKVAIMVDGVSSHITSISEIQNMITQRANRRIDMDKMDNAADKLIAQIQAEIAKI